MLLALVLAASAYALPKPTLYQPNEGDVLGPNYDISGTVGERALVVVLTDVLLSDTGRLVGTVPGIRHYSNADGTFSFRCASPRVPMGKREADILYRVRCFVVGPGGQRGPEAVVNCKAGTVSRRDAPGWGSIEEGVWNLKLLNAKRLVDGSRITAKFTDGRLGGHAGINQYFGNYKVSGRDLTISDIGSTKMAGPGPLMMQEQEYFWTLESARTHQVTGAELAVFDADGKVILAFGRTAPEPVALRQGLWELKTLNGKPVLDGTTVTARFTAGGIGGKGGINTYGGDYEVDGSKLSIGAVVSTMMAGDPAAMAQEQEYFKALSAAKSYTVVADELIIRDADGETILSFMRAAPEGK